LIECEARTVVHAEDRAAAAEAATKAYHLAWCDGPPFACHWGLEAARARLKALGAPEPTDLPPYDESKYEPMPEVEINPPDKFGSTADRFTAGPSCKSAAISECAMPWHGPEPQKFT